MLPQKINNGALSCIGKIVFSWHENTILPTHSSDKTLADQFLSFFHNKIDDIRTGLCAMVDEPLVEIPAKSVI